MPLVLLVCALAAALGAAYQLLHQSGSPAQLDLRGTAFAGQLAPDACLAYDPLQGNRHQTAFLDPGHGGVDPGATGATTDGTAIHEKDLTLLTAQDLRDILRRDGYRVVMSRAGDTLAVRLQPGDTDASGLLTGNAVHRDTTARIACANASGAAALVSIHFDAYGDPAVGGAETLYDSARPFAAANKRLAGLVQNSVLSALQSAGWYVPDRGIVDDTAGGTPAQSSAAAAYGHLLVLGPAAPGWLSQPSTMPGVLCEPLFITDPREADVVAQAAGQQALANGLAHGIEAFLASASAAS